MEQENGALVSKLKEDEHVIGHVEIDASDIFILTYNLLPTHPLYLKGWMGFFQQICVCKTFINFGFQTFCPPSFSMWENGWGILFWFKFWNNIVQLCRWYCYFFRVFLHSMQISRLGFNNTFILNFCLSIHFCNTFMLCLIFYL